jgi:hypothetical protein
MSKIVELDAAEIETVTGGVKTVAASTANASLLVQSSALNAQIQQPHMSLQSSNTVFQARRFD